LDGHRFVAQAVNAGARVVVVQEDAAGVDVPEEVFVLPVGDTREALARLAAAYYALDERSATVPRLIGVTGTNGKTTVCHLLRSILMAAGETPAMLGTVEYDLVGSKVPAPMTTPAPMDLCRYLSLARDAGASSVVMEVSSHALDQRRCDGLRFAAGVFTNLSQDHIDYHQSLQAYFQAKCRLFERLDRDATAVVNVDDVLGSRVESATRAVVRSYGLDRPADVTASNCRMTSTSSRLLLRGCAYEVEVECPLIGRHNIMNVLAAAATAEALGVEAAAIRKGVEGLGGVPGRLQRVTYEEHPFQVYVDYAHTDAALENVLDVLKPMTAGRLICVFGCGGDRDRSKRPRMAKAVERRADLAVVTSDNPRTEDPRRIVCDALAGFNAEGDCLVVVEIDRKDAIHEALLAAQPGDTVLIAGKGHEDYQIVGCQRRSFDDRVVARECLEALGVEVSAGA